MMPHKEIFSLYYPRLCHFAWQMTKDKELVQDIVHDAFLALWDNNPDMLPPFAIKNYLYATVRNSCINLARHEKVVSRYQTLQPFDEAQEPDILPQLIRSEIMAEILKIMESMPEGCKTVFQKGYLEGLSNIEVAQQLGISVSTVKTQKTRALKIIKSNLNPEFFKVFLFFITFY